MSAPQPTFQSMLQALRRARARCAAIARATGCPDAQPDFFVAVNDDKPAKQEAFL